VLAQVLVQVLAQVRGLGLWEWRAQVSAQVPAPPGGWERGVPVRRVGL